LQQKEDREDIFIKKGGKGKGGTFTSQFISCIAKLEREVNMLLKI
jgi:hypothetical protein